MRDDKKSKKALIVRALMETPIIRAAAAQAGISPRTVYRWMQEDDAFATAVQDAREIGLGIWEAELMDEAINGREEPIYYKGQPVGTRRVHSAGLKKYMLTAHGGTAYRASDSNRQRGNVEITLMWFGEGPLPDAPPGVRYEQFRAENSQLTADASSVQRALPATADNTQKDSNHVL